jgi:hypothetical protein
MKNKISTLKKLFFQHYYYLTYKAGGVPPPPLPSRGVPPAPEGGDPLLLREGDPYQPMGVSKLGPSSNLIIQNAILYYRTKMLFAD